MHAILFITIFKVPWRLDFQQDCTVNSCFVTSLCSKYISVICKNLKIKKFKRVTELHLSWWFRLGCSRKYHQNLSGLRQKKVYFLHVLHFHFELMWGFAHDIITFICRWVVGPWLGLFLGALSVKERMMSSLYCPSRRDMCHIHSYVIHQSKSQGPQ